MASFVSFSSGTSAKASEVNSNLTRLPPIGTVEAWLKSYTNTPSLPDGWVECNGQTLSDSESVYNGQVIPNLNGGSYRFLKGSSASGTTATPTHNHQWLTAHTEQGVNAGATDVLDTLASFQSDGVTSQSVQGVSDTAYTNLAQAEPPYYTVVWILRVK